jgi:hypothetical protein
MTKTFPLVLAISVTVPSAAAPPPARDPCKEVAELTQQILWLGDAITILHQTAKPICLDTNLHRCKRVISALDTVTDLADEAVASKKTAKAKCEAKKK